MVDLQVGRRMVGAAGRWNSRRGTATMPVEGSIEYTRHESYTASVYASRPQCSRENNEE